MKSMSMSLFSKLTFLLSSLQLRQENEALRGQLEGAMIPDRNDTDTSMQVVTDASKEEIETLQVRLDVASLYLTLR